MLKKTYRLTSNFHYHVTKKYGKKYVTPFFTIYACKPTNYAGFAKIGIVTGTALHKSAVHRNRVKRVISEVVRNNYLKLPKNTWLAIYTKTGILEKSYEEINTEFTKTLQSILVAK